ncbi:MAG: hypothetical protein IPI46_13235 [Bacteroidetes bacterium]|nr:hypothetical protein [Bacteroidota bacterium]
MVLNDVTVNGIGLGNPSTTTLYANLLDGLNNVVATTTVNANGTYTFATVYPGTYSIQVSINQGTVGQPAPATSLPTNWVNTGENLGVAAGNDGTVNGILTGIIVVATNVVDANFGIEELPTPSTITATSQVNPGGTTSVTVPPATFGATDPSSGTITSITITSFPTNATTITINGTTYTSGTFPGGGVTVPTTTNGEPTQAITVDPIDGAVTVGISYSATDNAGMTSTPSGVANVPFFTVGLSGTVFNDVDGLTDATVNGIGLGNPSTTTLYANLLDGLNNVVATTTVNANGTYTFATVYPGTYSIQVSINQGTVGQPAPATSLPTNWVNTGENLGVAAGNDGTVNGILTGIIVVATNVVDANFGIEELPTPSTITATSQVNPGGTTSVTVPPATFGATDPSSGTITSITITSFPSNATTITINGTTYTSGTFPGGGVTVPTTTNGEPTQAITVDPIDGAVTVGISYSATDNAGMTSTPSGVANVPFFTVGISGTVFNDVDGLTDATVNGTGLGNPSSTTMYVNLLSAGNVVATTTVNPNGTYNFPTVDPGSYTTQLSSVQGTVGQPAPATSLPTNWVNTGENLGLAAGNDGTVNGILTGITVVATNVVDANFGIEELPTPSTITATSQVNPGGTTSVTVPPATFGATDPSSGTITSITITSFPTNATTITINGTTYTSGTFPGGGVTVPTTTNGEPTQAITVDPIDGAVTVAIPYSATDNAGMTSTPSGVANVPFFTVGISGTLFDDVNGLNDNTVNGLGNGVPSSTPIYANLIDVLGNVVASVLLNSNGNYSFNEVNPGTYDIQVSTIQGIVGQPAPITNLPTGWIHTGENLGSTPGNDGIANGILTSVTVVSTPITQANFGIREPISLGNSVWNDFNKNGLQEVTELGIAGATANLYIDANTDGVPDGAAIATILSGANGEYIFDGLYAGNYIVGIVPPSIVGGAYTSSASGQELNPNLNIDGNDNGISTSGGETISGTITLTAGTEPLGELPNNALAPDVNANLTLDFGFFVCPSNFTFNPIYVCPGSTIDLTTLEPTNYTGGVWRDNNGVILATTLVSNGLFNYTYSNGLCVAMGSIDVIVNIPDYTPTLSIAPSAITGTSNVRVIATISEINNRVPCSDIYIMIPRLEPRFTFSYSDTATVMGGVSVSNADWQYFGTNPSFYVWKYIGATAFPAGGFSKLGFIGPYNPNETDGETSFGVQIFQGSGGEDNFTNNTDSEVLIYFR